MKIIELVLDETQEDSGIEAISIVENPAIEEDCLLYTSPSPRDAHESRMPSSA